MPVIAALQFLTSHKDSRPKSDTQLEQGHLTHAVRSEVLPTSFFVRPVVRILAGIHFASISEELDQHNGDDLLSKCTIGE